MPGNCQRGPSAPAQPRRSAERIVFFLMTLCVEEDASESLYVCVQCACTSAPRNRLEPREEKQACCVRARAGYRNERIGRSRSPSAWKSRFRDFPLRVTLRVMMMTQQFGWRPVDNALLSPASVVTRSSAGRERDDALASHASSKFPNNGNNPVRLVRRCPGAPETTSRSIEF